MTYLVEIGAIKTKNKKMADLLHEAQAAAATDMNVLICGETGTGHDALAEALQFMSAKPGEPFYVLRCYDDLTDEAIDNLSVGLTYLDEVQRLSLSQQRKLLVKLRDKGEGMRIISSASTTIDDMVQRRVFYKNLYNILSDLRLDIPPLRERREDICSMIKELIHKYNLKYQKNVKIEDGAMKLLKMYTYPGNIAELDSLMRRAVLISSSGTIKTNSIMSVLDMDKVLFTTLVKGSNIEYQKEIDRLSKELIINALMDTGSLRKAARQLALNHVTMWNKCNDLGIDIKKYDQSNKGTKC